MALRLLVAVEAGAWSDRLLQAHEPKLADPRDRRLLHNLVMTSLRWQGALDRALGPAVHGAFDQLDPLVRAALRIGLCQLTPLQLPAPVAVSSAVDALRQEGGEKASGLVNAVLRRLVRDGLPVLDPRATIPTWLLERWQRELGVERTDALLRRINQPPTACFVLRRGAVTRAQLLAEWAAEGLQAEASHRDPDAVRVTRGAAQSSPAFGRGDLIAMDEGAALVASLARPTDNLPVADLAASPGGKALRLAHWTDAPLIALELVASRCGTLARTLRERGPVGRCLTLRADACRPPLQRGVFGTVLLDAPCSGTGTLRRRPERRWRVTLTQIETAASQQAALLDGAADLVARGGRLIFAVCSLEPEEGRLQIAAFVQRHPEFELQNPAEFVVGNIEGLVCTDPLRIATRPDSEDHDGFVAAAMIRRR